MQKIISVYKPIGLTPLEVIRKLRVNKPELSKITISYAGRLDPLAHGVLLLMIGEETKKREAYLSFAKKYEFEVIFGITTDTYDLLGIVGKTSEEIPTINVNLIVNTFVNKYIGKHTQFYPPYSSKTVKGKPLFWWSRNGKLHEIEIPKREIEIYAFRCLSLGELSLKNLKQKVITSISSVNGDFRQKEIAKSWQEFFDENKNEKFKTAKFSIHCSSGTYIRELVHQLGKEAGCGAVAIDILRTAVDEYTLERTLKV